MDLSAKIENSSGFSAQKQVISKKKVFTEIETDFSAEIVNSNGFSAQKQVISKKMVLRRIFRPKLEIHTILPADSRQRLHYFGTQIPSGGCCFQFFSKNRPQKHQKHAILHTLQANGGARVPPPPLATLLYR